MSQANVVHLACLKKYHSKGLDFIAFLRTSPLPSPGGEGLKVNKIKSMTSTADMDSSFSGSLRQGTNYRLFFLSFECQQP